jgi:hypothetical protein
MTPAEFDAALAELVEDETEREPYDPFDPYEHQDTGWEDEL